MTKTKTTKTTAKKEITGRQDLKVQSVKTSTTKPKTDKSEKKTKKVSDAKVSIEIQTKVGPELTHTAAELVSARMAGYEAAQADSKEYIAKLQSKVDELTDLLADAMQDVSYLKSSIEMYMEKGVVGKMAFALNPTLFTVALINMMTGIEEETSDNESNPA